MMQLHDLIKPLVHENSTEISELYRRISIELKSPRTPFGFAFKYWFVLAIFAHLLHRQASLDCIACCMCSNHRKSDELVESPYSTSQYCPSIALRRN